MGRHELGYSTTKLASRHPRLRRLAIVIIVVLVPTLLFIPRWTYQEFQRRLDDVRYAREFTSVAFVGDRPVLIRPIPEALPDHGPDFRWSERRIFDDRRTGHDYAVRYGAWLSYELFPHIYRGEMIADNGRRHLVELNVGRVSVDSTDAFELREFFAVLGFHGLKPTMLRPSEWAVRGPWDFAEIETDTWGAITISEGKLSEDEKSITFDVTRTIGGEEVEETYIVTITNGSFNLTSTRTMSE